MNADQVRQKTVVSLNFKDTPCKIIAWKIVAGSSVEKVPLASAEWRKQNIIGEVPEIPSKDKTNFI